MTFQTKIGLSATEAVQINKQVMLGSAADVTFIDEIEHPAHDFESVENHHFGVLRAFMVAMMFDGVVNGEVLNLRVQMQNEVGESTARKHILEVTSMKLLSEQKSPNDGRGIVYSFADGVQAKFAEYSKLELEILEVIKTQIANPTDPRAGSDLIAEDLYFNVIDPKARSMANEALAKKREAKNKNKEVK